MTFKHFILALGLIAYCSAPAAEPQPAPWKLSQKPLDPTYDWIELTSGEWLRGDLIVLYNDKLEFDSDKMGVRTIKLKDIRQLRTRNEQKVLLEHGPFDLDLAAGKLVIKEDRVWLINNDEVRELERDSILSVADNAMKEVDRWSGSVSAALNLRSGNNETTDLTILADATRRTAYTRFSLDYTANYSSTRGSQTVNKQRVVSDIDLFIGSNLFYKLAAAEYYTDRFSNIDDQFSIYTGLGLEFIDTSRTDWSFGTGIGYQFTSYISTPANQDDPSESPFWAIGTDFEYELTNDIDFTFSYSLRWLNQSNGLYTHHLVSKLSADLIGDLSFDVSIIWDRIEKPQAAEDGTLPKQDDTQLLFGLGYSF